MKTKANKDRCRQETAGKQYLPTPQQIRERCRIIRHDWSEEVRKQRVHFSRSRLLKLCLSTY